MKILKERTQIAEAINFDKYPVLTIDTSNTYEIGGKVVGFIGCKVRSNPSIFRGVKLYDRCTLCWFEDKKIFTLSGSSVTLSARFGYTEIIEDVEYANAPIVEKNQEVVIIVYNSKTNQMLNPMIVNLEKREQIDLMELFKED